MFVSFKKLRIASFEYNAVINRLPTFVRLPLSGGLVLEAVGHLLSVVLAGTSNTQDAHSHCVN